MNTGDTLELRVSRKSFGEFARDANGAVVGEALDSLLPQARENEDAMASLIYNMDWSYSAAVSGRGFTLHTTERGRLRRKRGGFSEPERR